MWICGADLLCFVYVHRFFILDSHCVCKLIVFICVAFVGATGFRWMRWFSDLLLLLWQMCWFCRFALAFVTWHNCVHVFLFCLLNLTLLLQIHVVDLLKLLLVWVGCVDFFCVCWRLLFVSMSSDFVGVKNSFRRFALTSLMRINCVDSRRFCYLFLFCWCDLILLVCFNCVGVGWRCRCASFLLVWICVLELDWLCWCVSFVWNCVGFVYVNLCCWFALALSVWIGVAELIVCIQSGWAWLCELRLPMCIHFRDLSWCNLCEITWLMCFDFANFPGPCSCTSVSMMCLNLLTCLHFVDVVVLCWFLCCCLLVVMLLNYLDRANANLFCWWTFNLLIWSIFIVLHLCYWCVFALLVSFDFADLCLHCWLGMVVWITFADVHSFCDLCGLRCLCSCGCVCCWFVFTLLVWICHVDLQCWWC